MQLHGADNEIQDLTDVRTGRIRTDFLVFIGILAIVAAVVTLAFVELRLSRQQAAQTAQDAAAVEKAKEDVAAAQKKAEADRTVVDKAADEQARERALAKHEAELKRYLTGTVSRNPGMASVAIAVASEDGKLDRHVGEALARRLHTNTVEMLPSLFTAEFLTDGLFADTIAGSRLSLARLDLTNTLDGLVLAREEVGYSQNPSLENTTSAHLKIDVTIIPTKSSGNGESWTLTTDGVGFHQDEARSMAEDRLIKKIAEDTNIILNLNSTTNR